MTVWLWLIVGVTIYLALSILVGLALAAILRTVSHDVSQLLEPEPWSSAPLLRGEEPEATTDQSRVRSPVRR
jgi:hypothetical protein